MDEELRRELAATVAEYRASLAPRIAALESLRAELASGKAPAARLTDLHRELHSIAGSGRTFGFASVSEAARAAEAFVELRRAPGNPPDRAAWEHLKSLLGDLALAVP